MHVMSVQLLQGEQTNLTLWDDDDVAETLNSLYVSSRISNTWYCTRVWIAKILLLSIFWVYKLLEQLKFRFLPDSELELELKTVRGRPKLDSDPDPDPDPNPAVLWFCFLAFGIGIPNPDPNPAVQWNYNSATSYNSGGVRNRWQVGRIDSQNLLIKKRVSAWFGYVVEVARFRFLRIGIPIPWYILEELEPGLESKELWKESKKNHFSILNSKSSSGPFAAC